MSKIEQVKHYANKVVALIKRQPRGTNLTLPIHKLNQFCTDVIEAIAELESSARVVETVAEQYEKAEIKKKNANDIKREKEDRQQFIFEFICDYHKKHKEIPSNAVISDNLRIEKKYVIGACNALYTKRSLVKDGSVVTINRDA